MVNLQPSGSTRKGQYREPAGCVDALYINPLGQITLTEFKLWWNLQSRREMIGQILDYAKELASWSYEDLQRPVSIALTGSGNILYSLVDAHSPGIDEAEFVDNPLSVSVVHPA